MRSEERIKQAALSAVRSTSSLNTGNKSTMDQAVEEPGRALELETVDACPLCGGCEMEVKYRVRHISGDPLHAWAEKGFPAATLAECRHCGFVCKSERPSLAYLADHYAQSGEDYIERVAEDHPTIREDFRAAAEFLRQCFPKGGSVLDVGCASGFFLESLPSGWKKHGLEILRLAVEKARQRNGIVVHECDIVQAGLADESFDAVSAFDVVEHLAEPMMFFREAFRILKPGGRLILGTGNSSSFSATMAGNRWTYVAIPEHISFFSPRSLKAGLKRAGFSEVTFKRIHHGDRSLSVATGWIRAVGKHWAINVCGDGVVKLKFFRQNTPEFLIPYFFDHMLCIAWGRGKRE